VLSAVVIIARFVSGAGSGSCQQFYVSGMLHLTPVAARSEHTARWVFSGMLAIGLGPVFAAAVQGLDPCSDGPHFELVGHAQIVVALGSMTAVAWLHPDLKDCSDCMESDSEEGPKSGERWQRRMVVCGCLVMASLRSFGVSAIEVVIAMLLEENYQWDQRATGLTIGSVFLCCIPLKIVYSLVNRRMSVVGWVRLLALVAAAGTGLLFTATGRVLCLDRLHIHGAQQLILAGVVVFPTFYLSDALGSGLMHQHVLPEGSLLDGNHAQLWYNLMQGMGRFLGPWLARSAVYMYGQDSFAAQQLLVTCLFFADFELIVRPFLKTGEELQQKEGTLRQVSM